MHAVAGVVMLRVRRCRCAYVGIRRVLRDVVVQRMLPTIAFRYEWAKRGGCVLVGRSNKGRRKGKVRERALTARRSQRSQKNGGKCRARCNGDEG